MAVPIPKPPRNTAKEFSKAMMEKLYFKNV